MLKRGALGLLLGSCVLLAGCHPDSLVDATGALALNQAELDFHTAYAGHQAVEKTVTLHNQGHATLDVTWTQPALPFELLTTPNPLNPGDTTVRVRFRPTAVGDFSSQLAVNSSRQTLTLLLKGSGVAIPDCGQPETCHALTFDPAQGSCVDTVEPDGTACDPHDVCLQQTSCVSGRCIGQPIACDDGNACTTDTCNALLGCQHLPAPPCPGDGACLVGTCDPKLGCSMVPADDGTPCGPMQTCDAAQVCVSGQCALRDPPDGYVCAPASPCQAQGVCVGSTCAQAAAVPLSESWSFDGLDAGTLDDGGVVQVTLSDFVLDETSNELSLMGFFQTPKLRANTPQALDAPGGGARRCMLWNGRQVCADHPGGINGQVTVLDRETGAIVWTFALELARPDFKVLTSNLFMGRLAVLGSDRLAALFEGYVAGGGSGTADCRLYFLTVLDASGALISSAQLTDPELTSCDHPHPYGFSSDTLGNFYVGFAPTTSSGGPPLHPAARTTMMSFTRDGTFRWKFTDYQLVGGELAVADGLLFPENSTQAIDTSTGQLAYQLPEVFGRTVLTHERQVVAPADGALALDGYRAKQPVALYTHQLTPGTHFWGDQVRLASWATPFGSQTVALTFTAPDVDGAMPSLHAFYVDDGRPAFSCPLAFNVTPRGPPQLTEVGQGTFALMDGAGCEKCDPPFASSAGEFHTFGVPLLSPAVAPWLGTFGGAGHDGQEDVALPTLGGPTNPPGN